MQSDERTLRSEDLALIDSIRITNEKMSLVIEELEKIADYDQRWVAIGKAHFRQGCTALIHAITGPT